MRDNAKNVEKVVLFMGKIRFFGGNRHKFEGIIGEEWPYSPKSMKNKAK